MAVNNGTRHLPELPVWARLPSLMQRRSTPAFPAGTEFWFDPAEQIVVDGRCYAVELDGAQMVARLSVDSEGKLLAQPIDCAVGPAALLTNTRVNVLGRLVRYAGPVV